MLPVRVGGLTHGIPFLLYIRYPPSFLFELLDNLSKSCFLVLCPWKDKKRAFMLLHINALTLFYYKIVLAVVPYKLEVIHIYIPFVIYITIYNPLVSEQIFSKSFLWYYHLQTILATLSHFLLLRTHIVAKIFWLNIDNFPVSIDSKSFLIGCLSFLCFAHRFWSLHKRI